MSGGEIINNESTKGGGVYDGANDTYGKFTIDGESEITSNNNSAGSASNAYFENKTVITIGSGFDTKSSIGVTAYTAPTCSKSVKITNAINTDISAGFSSDNPEYSVAYQNNILNLIKAHSYLFEHDNDNHWGKCTVCNTEMKKRPTSGMTARSQYPRLKQPTALRPTPAWFAAEPEPRRSRRGEGIRGDPCS